MWIFLNDAFLSIVDGGPSRLTVRARRREDLARTFPEHNAAIIETPRADYGFRLPLPRMVVAAAILERVLGIDYPNFKRSVSEDERHSAYCLVWEDMFAFQRRAPTELDAPLPHAESRPRFSYAEQKALLEAAVAEAVLDAGSERISDKRKSKRKGKGKGMRRGL